MGRPGGPNGPSQVFLGKAVTNSGLLTNLLSEAGEAACPVVGKPLQD